MNWNGQRITGRHVIDVDGCLRTTDLDFVTAADVIALHGGLSPATSLVMELAGESIPLGSADRVVLDEATVAFFRSVGRSGFRMQPLVGRPSETHALAA